MLFQTSPDAKRSFTSLVNRSQEFGRREKNDGFSRAEERELGDWSKRSREPKRNQRSWCQPPPSESTVTAAKRNSLNSLRPDPDFSPIHARYGNRKHTLPKKFGRSACELQSFLEKPVACSSPCSQSFALAWEAKLEMDVNGCHGSTSTIWPHSTCLLWRISISAGQ